MYQSKTNNTHKQNQNNCQKEKNYGNFKEKKQSSLSFSTLFMLFVKDDFIYGLYRSTLTIKINHLIIKSWIYCGLQFFFFFFGKLS